MKSLNSYINEGFFSNVGAVAIDVNKWIETYNKTRVSKPINMNYVDIDEYGNAVFHPKAMTSMSGVAGYLQIVNDDKNKDILMPNGALPPNISFSDEQWTRVQIDMYDNGFDVKSMIGFPTKLQYFGINYDYPPGKKCSPIHVNLSDWGVTKCKSVILNGAVIDDIKYLPICEKLSICAHISLVYKHDFDDMLNSLISKWNGWVILSELDLKFGSPRLISNKGLALVYKIDEFIKKKYPDLYACRDYNNIEHIIDTSGRLLTLGFAPSFRDVYIDINDMKK